MRLRGDEYVLASGRRFYAHGGILGLSEAHLGIVFEGYDGEVQNEQEWDDEARLFTDGERREIAAHMISLWRKWGRVP